jgi:hypothetical protein
MKWYLIAIALSDWNGTALSWHSVGSFNEKTACIAERDRLTASLAASMRYVCANEAIEHGK